CAVPGILAVTSCLQASERRFPCRQQLLVERFVRIDARSNVVLTAYSRLPSCCDASRRVEPRPNLDHPMSESLHIVRRYEPASLAFPDEFRQGIDGSSYGGQPS